MRPATKKGLPEEWGVNQLNWLSQIIIEISTPQKWTWLREVTHINFPAHVWCWDIPVSYASFPYVGDDEGLAGFFAS